MSAVYQCVIYYFFVISYHRGMQCYWCLIVFMLNDCVYFLLLRFEYFNIHTKISSNIISLFNLARYFSLLLTILRWLEEILFRGKFTLTYYVYLCIFFCNFGVIYFRYSTFHECFHVRSDTCFTNLEPINRALL